MSRGPFKSGGRVLKQNQTIYQIEDKNDDEKCIIYPENKNIIIRTKQNPCKKCCLNFESKEKLIKLISEMQEAKLTFQTVVDNRTCI